MESSRRAVESYWRSRMIDSATSDEDKVTPVYKLEEICETLRCSHVSIIKEISEFILKRLDHKSPIVKQKALRLIKYAVGKSGVEFRREMQRHSAVLRQMLHYKGQPDPLKGDALNKAVRDTAQDTVSAIFSEETRASHQEDLNKRIQGFGSSSITPQSETKKSFLDEIVRLGSASFKQGIISLTQGNYDHGNWRGHALRRSLNTDAEYDRHEPRSFTTSDTVDGPFVLDSRFVDTENVEEEHVASVAPEERLLDNVINSGHVRLQPSRDAVHVFLKEAAKVDPLCLSNALEAKLRSPSWQVRVKAMCVLESILRRKENANFLSIASYFVQHKDAIVKCSESLQSSLKEKACKVLILLEGGKSSSVCISNISKKDDAPMAEMPDLLAIDDNNSAPCNDASALFIQDLLGEDVSAKMDLTSEEDPFADVSFHNIEGVDATSDSCQDSTVHEMLGLHTRDPEKNPPVPDPFGGPVWEEHGEHQADVHCLISGLSIEGSVSPAKNHEISHGFHTSGARMNPVVPPQNTGYSVSLNYQQVAAIGGEHSLPFPDIFHPGLANNSLVSTDSLKREDSKAFDFINEHLSAVRDSKRPV